MMTEVQVRSVSGPLDDGHERLVKAAVAVLSAFALLIVAWSALAPLDAAVKATGQVTVAGHDDIIAHREGGVLAEIDVSDGQHVRAGQILAKLAPESVGADASALKGQVISLEAQRARLSAELANSPAIEWPNDFLALTGDDEGLADEAMRVQQAQFEADAAELRAQAAAGAAKSHGLRDAISGEAGQLTANALQQDLLGEQLRGVSSLAAQGYASRNSVRSLQRSAAELSGTRAQLVANMNQERQQISESQLLLQTVRKQRAETTAAALRDTEDQLAAAQPKLAAAQAQLDRGTLRAEVDGVVTGLSVFRPGTVVAPGQRFMEVVPDSPTLMIEGNLAANDAGSVRVGQSAQVRIETPDARTVGLLHGSVKQISADSFLDERSGRRYFTVSVIVPKTEISRFEKATSQGRLRPGLPAEVLISLRARNAFEYLFEPITQSLWSAFRQP